MHGFDVNDACAEDGTNVQLWSNVKQDTQIGTVTRHGDGFYTIVHKLTGNFARIQSHQVVPRQSTGSA